MKALSREIMQKFVDQAAHNVRVNGVMQSYCSRAHTSGFILHLCMRIHGAYFMMNLLQLHGL